MTPGQMTDVILGTTMTVEVVVTTTIMVADGSDRPRAKRSFIDYAGGDRRKRDHRGYIWSRTTTRHERPANFHWLLLSSCGYGCI